jgi:hypothetical protein
MLGFGEVSPYLGYIALKDHFPHMALKPNPECTSYWCRKQQVAYAKRRAEELANAPPEPEPEPEAPVVHESNEWGIELTGDDDGDDEAAASGGGGGGGGAQQQQQQLAAGVQFAHVSSSQLKPEVRKEDQVGDEGAVDLSDLMAQLTAVQK